MSAAPAREEEQLKAYEEQLSRMQSIDIALQAAASLLNIGGMRLGLSAGASERRDLEQVRDAIDGVRALMPIIERRLPAEETGRLRDALSQLQMAYAQLVRETATATAGAGAHDARGPSEPASGGAQQPGAGGTGGAGGGQAGGAAGPSQPPSPSADEKGRRGPGPAEASGRLWVPGRR